MLTIQDANTDALLRDAAALAKRDPEFKDAFDRFCISGSGIRATVAWTLMTNVIDADRHVPWTGDELIEEVRRRKAEKKRSANGDA